MLGQPTSSGGSPHRRLDPMLLADAMAIPRPPTNSDWASAPDASHPRVEPSAPTKAAGFAAGGRASAATVNWLFYSYDQWTDWFDEFIASNGAS